MNYKNLCIATTGFLAFSSVLGSDISHQMPTDVSFAQYKLQDSFCELQEYRQEINSDIDFANSLVQKARQDLLAQYVKIIYEETDKDYVDDYGDMLFCDITIETNDNFTVKDMIKLNADIVKKHNLFDNKIIFTLHTA
ncbi:hypothetical protein [Campylobacter concisus]|jgi:hypothetical protein|nr:hypothetical protein [Campylobacter concisus]DAQ52003.1 MAG TPA: hypothetical protein [Caudoviricetes sp.]DAS61821.1 MAG TPA: hypothetical protein [Caudoviricetes sp.]